MKRKWYLVTALATLSAGKTTMTYLLLAVAFLSTASVAAPQIERLVRFGIFHSQSIPGPKADDRMLNEAAMHLMRKILSKSSFADLKIEESKKTFSNNDGTQGHNAYSMNLTDGDGNRFRSTMNMDLKVSTWENPRNGNIFHRLIVTVTDSSFGTTRMYNFKNDEILRLTE